VPRYDYPGGYIVAPNPEPPPESLPGGWFTVWVTCDRSYTRVEENAIAQGVWAHLQHVPRDPTGVWPPKVTARNPMSAADGWGLTPWDVFEVRLQRGPVAWHGGQPWGVTNSYWRNRKAQPGTVACYVGLSDHERQTSGVAAAVVRALHEFGHAVADLPHADDPHNVMYPSPGVSASFTPEQLAAIGRVRP
jgi:hypothetical protein